MKRILLSFFTFGCLLVSMTGFGQATFTVPHDTVIVPAFSTTAAPHDDITNVTAANLRIKWHVTATDATFPSDWLTPSAFGICDDSMCRGNGGNQLWNPGTGSGSFFTSTYYANSAHDSTAAFNLSLDFSSATSSGTHWVTINLQDQGTGFYTKQITFIINKIPTAVPQLNNANGDVVLYPNPASDEINLVYDASLDVKNLAVYNIIGKMMAVYKVAGNSANVSLDGMPSGIYLVRLVNGQGNIVATKKFTKQ